MIRPLQIVLVLPLVAWVCYMTFTPLSKVKNSWFVIGLGYGIAYVAVFFLWLKVP
jgi:hypothetical protein